MKQYNAEEADEIHLKVGQPVKLESLREAVVPPYIMLMPFLETPDHVVVKEQQALDEDGVHGSIFVLEATKPIDDHLTVGFRDLQTGDTTHAKKIRVIGH